jgi:hypothetical protein
LLQVGGGIDVNSIRNGLESVESLFTERGLPVANDVQKRSLSLGCGAGRLPGRWLFSFAGGRTLATISMKFWPGAIARYAPLLTLLLAYFFLTVLMNLVFVVYGGRLAVGSIEDFSIAAFPVQTLGYWLLLFLPFLIVPPVAIFFRYALEQRARNLAEWMPEFRLRDYLVVAGICYAIVVHAMYRSDAWGLLWSGADAISAVLARFELLDRLQFFERAALQSVLIFLTLYSVVRALRAQEVIWYVLSAVNLVAMTTLLVSLNMKWPVVVLYGGVVACTALFGKHRAIQVTIAAIAMVCVYLLVATVVLRIPQSTSRTEGATLLRTEVPTFSRTEVPTLSRIEVPTLSRTEAPTVQGTVKAAATSSQFLAVSGLLRMALPYPFYYQTFTDEGPVCGTILDRVARRHNPCQPSLLIYERMFKNDGFAGFGTAPAAFHITGYALNGWLGAVIETVLASIVIGAFMALPANASAVSGTAAVMGILSAYFFSQLPFEGPVVYDHGLLWWLLLIVGYALVRHAPALRKFVRRSNDAAA